MIDDKNNTGNDSEKLLYCSFCGKSQHEVKKLIAGPSVYVCDECVELCNDIILEEMEEDEESADGDKKAEADKDEEKKEKADAKETEKSKP